MALVRQNVNFAKRQKTSIIMIVILGEFIIGTQDHLNLELAESQKFNYYDSIMNKEKDIKTQKAISKLMGFDIDALRSKWVTCRNCPGLDKCLAKEMPNIKNPSKVLYDQQINQR
jgi:hypothetical protein